MLRNTPQLTSAIGSYIYWSELDGMLTSHPVSDPLFLYLSIHMVHEPYQAPASFQAIYADAPLCAQRKMLQAMVSVVDTLVHNLTGKLNATVAARPSFPASGSTCSVQFIYCICGDIFI